MSFQNVDSFHGIFDVSSHIDRLHGKHGIHSHRSKQIIITIGPQIHFQHYQKVDTHFPMILLDIVVFATFISASLPKASTFMLS